MQNLWTANELENVPVQAVKCHVICLNFFLTFYKDVDPAGRSYSFPSFLIGKKKGGFTEAVGVWRTPNATICEILLPQRNHSKCSWLIFHVKNISQNHVKFDKWIKFLKVVVFEFGSLYGNIGIDVCLLACHIILTRIATTTNYLQLKCF